MDLSDRCLNIKLGITCKLFIVILTSCTTVLLVSSIASRLAFKTNFLGYLNQQGVNRMEMAMPELVSAYQENQFTWKFLEHNKRTWYDLLRVSRHNYMSEHGAPLVADQIGAVPRMALLDKQYQVIVGNSSADAHSILLPIRVNSQVVGWFALVPFQKAVTYGAIHFYQQQLKNWWMIGLASIVFAALIAWLISGTVLRRVHRVKNATQQLAQGDYSVRLVENDRDEVDQLASHFNLLAKELDDTEQKRRQFMTDISHELRTPLAVMRAEIEAMEDGIRPMNTRSLNSLSQQMAQLNKLVDDLHELSVTDNGINPTRSHCVDLTTLLQSTVEGIATQAMKAELKLDFVPYPHPLLMQGDEVRLIQLFANLLSNSVKYTNAGGKLVIRCNYVEQHAHITIEDSAPAVDTHHIPHLFERFYRCDASRSRKSGGSGLGLAICRNIVSAHHGKISAATSSLGGLKITITLPVSTC